MDSKNWFVKSGDFFFKYRNAVFPVILMVLLVAFPPPSSYFGSPLLENIKSFFAIFLIVFGLGFRAATIGFAYIKRGGLNKQVYADTLVTEGFFNLCRNPLYVGNMAIYAGIFILHGHHIVMITGIALYYIIYAMIIAAEEHFLKNKFGEEYAVYCVRTARWIPNFSNYGQAVKGMSFSLGRVIAKDYTTIFNALAGVLLIECLKAYYLDAGKEFTQTCQVAAIIIVLSLSIVATIKYMKKSGKLS